jgi:hypothetical protein
MQFFAVYCGLTRDGHVAKPGKGQNNNNRGPQPPSAAYTPYKK